jgi:hypothetical protein
MIDDPEMMLHAYRMLALLIRASMHMPL